MELVWGPELSFKESSSEVYKFLGSEKYTSVLNSIYAGLGVPPTLTGMATNGGGFTNNFISLKTLVERLQYGRDLLTKFWEKEIEIVRQAMGFRHRAHIQFDRTTLADEATEKKLLIELADRDIISGETLLQRFKEIPEIEKIRLKREMSERDNEKSPPKAGPYHNAEHKQSLEKIALQTGKVLPQDLGLETSVPKDLLMPQKNVPNNVGNPRQKSKNPNPNGRPPMSLDTEPRKQRIAKPTNKPSIAELIVWAENSWDNISSILNTSFLSMKNKKNLRQLTKAEVSQLEQLKIDVLTNIEVLSKVNAESIYEILKSKTPTPKEFKAILQSKNINIDSMTIDDYRKNIIGLYVERNALI
jgi:hypothetical protein